MRPDELRRHSFRAMGTGVTLTAERRAGDRRFERAVRAVQTVFAREEMRFSRFRGESELTRVNERAGRWTKVSSGFAALLRHSLEAAARTGGLFDPTVLPALIAAGYDRDFDEVIAGARGALHPPKPCGRWREVDLDDDLVHLPQGVGLDFGGVAKGWTVDLAANAALAQGLAWAVVNAGGDLRVAGRTPRDGIAVAVEDPDDRDQEALRLTLEGGALATSSVTARAWGPGLHHLIDPRIGLPASTGVVQATVWAETCAEAEIRSKWALLEGPSVLDHMSAVLVMEDGHVIMNLEPQPLEEVVA
jgi:thiamine biosynthesis lipoprotein